MVLSAKYISSEESNENPVAINICDNIAYIGQHRKFRRRNFLSGEDCNTQTLNYI